MSVIQSVMRTLGFVPAALFDKVYADYCTVHANVIRHTENIHEVKALVVDAERLASAAQRTARDYRDKLTESDAKLVVYEERVGNYALDMQKQLNNIMALETINDALRQEVGALQAEIDRLNDLRREATTALQLANTYPRLLGAHLHYITSPKDTGKVSRVDLEIEFVGPGGLEVTVTVRSLAYSKTNQTTLNDLAAEINKHVMFPG